MARAARVAACELEEVRVLLLRHAGRARGEGVRQAHEADLVGRPDQDERGRDIGERAGLDDEPLSFQLLKAGDVLRPERHPRAQLHDAVTLTLADAIDVSRGDMIVSAANAPEAARSLSATLCWFDERALDRRRTYLLRHTTREVRARIDRLDHLWNVSTQEEEPAPDALGRTTSDGLPIVALGSLPKEARTVHALILKGGPFRYERDGGGLGLR